MTEQERQLIQSLTTRIENAPAPQIDHDADELIRQSLTRPDALYLLVQTVLIQDMALNQAKAQIDELKRQQPAAQPAASSGFLPGQPAPHPGESSAWTQGGQAQGGWESHVQQPQTPPPPPPQTAAPPSSGFGSFLRSAATTAAGVIAGETAFSALSSIFGHHEGGYAGGSGFLSGAPVSPGSETIINNYYEDDRDRDDDRSDIDRDDVDRGSDRQDSDQIDDDQDSGNDDTDDTDDSSFDDDSSDDDGSVDV